MQGQLEDSLEAYSELQLKLDQERKRVQVYDEKERLEKQRLAQEAAELEAAKQVELEKASELASRSVSSSLRTPPGKSLGGSGAKRVPGRAAAPKARRASAFPSAVGRKAAAKLVAPARGASAASSAASRTMSKFDSGVSTSKFDEMDFDTVPELPPSEASGSDMLDEASAASFAEEPTPPSQPTAGRRLSAFPKATKRGVPRSALPKARGIPGRRR
eukprot:GHVU01028024.1.p1 GENE.GHVU01028024.1~~GHVU01028024.1.p1  ORF type:complete len:217 (-),score=37.28 GHVU01028024.1:405-1055(-)